MAKELMLPLPNFFFPCTRDDAALLGDAVISSDFLLAH
jgi:hypothetical protein